MAVGTRITFPENMRVFNVTLNKDSWTTNGNMFNYTVTISGLTSNQIVFVHNAMNLSKEDIEAFGKACITAKSQSNGSFILQALNKPDRNLNIVVELGGECLTT